MFIQKSTRRRPEAHERYERYKLAKTVLEAVELGALRSDITSDLKNGHCARLALEEPAKRRRLEEPPPVAPVAVDLSGAKLEGKPMKFIKRTMGEAKRLLSAEGLAEAERSGYHFCLRDKEDLSRWFVQLRDLNPDGKLLADLKKHGLEPSIDLELTLPDEFPMSPPFVRVLYPQLKGGYVFERGGICFEPLTQKGWVPSMTLPALAIAIKGIFDYGEVRVAGVGDKATRSVKHYTEEGARKDLEGL